MKPFYEHHGFEPFERDEDEDDAGMPRVLRCKRCGSTDVRWRQQGGRWVLFSLQPGVEHKCGRTASADDFEDLTT